MRRLGLFCLVSLSLLLTQAVGQEKEPEGPPVARGKAGGKKGGPDGPGKGPDKDTPKESPRMQRLKQLSFDRRPSAILKAWAPQPPPVEKKIEKKDGKEPSRNALNASVAILLQNQPFAFATSSTYFLTALKDVAKKPDPLDAEMT